MTIDKLRNSKSTGIEKSFIRSFFLSCVLSIVSWYSFGQVTSSIDSTSIKIGEQITYQINVEADSTDLVVFPEGQTFQPLEMIESYKIDTTINDAKFNLIKKYGLTQFDSGAYTIPRQKIVIGSNTFFTDSLKVEVNNIEIDTTKQGLYDIKPFTEVDKSSSKWWKYLLFGLLALGLLAFLLYWFIWRKKPLTEDEKVALLPPYDRAKLALKKLEESDYLQNEALKDYYSELTLIIRKYLDEKVYDHSMESTTNQLIDRLRLLKEGNQIDLSAETIKNLESILKRADLVKFAKSTPDVALAELDRNTIDSEIDHVKEALPEPTEEEKLLDQKYLEELERKKKRKKIILTAVITVLVVLATITGFTIKYGFDYVKDTIIGHDSKELLETKNWVTSDYGVPPITITTPKVLKRVEVPIPDEFKEQMETVAFAYGSVTDFFTVMTSTTVYKNDQIEIDMEKAIEGNLTMLEQQGVQNLITKQDKFVTPNGAEGVKTHGTASVPVLNTGKYTNGNFAILSFTNEQVLQQIILSWRSGDVYAEQMAERIMNSIELIKPKTETE